MEHTIITIKNFTDVSIELYRSTSDSKQLVTAKKVVQIPTLEKDLIHGHSSIGSFVITKDSPVFSCNTFGKLSLIYRQENGKIIFDVVKKR